MDNNKLDKLEKWLETEMNARQALAYQFLSRWAPYSQKSSFNLWLVLPSGWLSHEFVEQAQNKGVLVRSADDYRVGQFMPAPAVRLCVSRPNSRAELTEALTILKNILEQGPLLKEAVM